MALKFNTMGRNAFVRGWTTSYTSNNNSTFLGAGLRIFLYPTTVSFPVASSLATGTSSTLPSGYIASCTNTVPTYPTITNPKVSATLNMTPVANTAFNNYGWFAITHGGATTASNSARWIACDSISTHAGSVLVVPQMFHDGSNFTVTLAFTPI